MADGTSKLEQIRQLRKRKYPETSIESSILSIRRNLKKTNKQLTNILEAWDEFVPEQISMNAMPTSLRAGILEVSVNDSPTAYQLNQLLRTGLLQKLQEKSSATLKQIKVRLAK
jgi:hypothetical protein